MIRRAFVLFLALWLTALPGLAQAQTTFPGFPPGVFQTRAALDGPPPSGCTEASNFLGRVTSQSGTYQTAITNFICGLVSNGIFAKADAAYLLRAHESATGYTNLISSSFGISESGNVSFISDQGVTSRGGSLLTGFNPTTASTPKYVQNSGTIAARSETSALILGPLIGNPTPAGTTDTIYPRYTGDVDFWRVNQATNNSTTATDGSGLWIAVRSGATTNVLYRNGASFDTSSTASVAPANQEIMLLKHDTEFYTGIVTFAFIGSALDATDAANLNTLLNTYLAAVVAATCTQALAYLSAIVTQSPNYVAAYTIAICGLVTDGVFAKLDCGWLFKAHEAATALLSITLSANCVTSSSGATFTADVGYAGNGSTTYVDTGFNPSSATTPKYVQNDGSIFVRSSSSGQSAGGAFGYVGGSGSAAFIYPRYTDDNFYGSVNSLTGLAGVASITDGSGLFTAVRTSSTNLILYRNTTASGNIVDNSAAVGNSTFAFFRDLAHFWAGTLTAGGLGSQLSATDVGNLNSRINTFLASVP